MYCLDSTLLVVTSFPERIAQPLQTLIKTVTRGSAGRLDVLAEG